MSGDVQCCSPGFGNKTGDERTDRIVHANVFPGGGIQAAKVFKGDAFGQDQVPKRAACQNHLVG